MEDTSSVAGRLGLSTRMGGGGAAATAAPATEGGGGGTGAAGAHCW